MIRYAHLFNGFFLLWFGAGVFALRSDLAGVLGALAVRDIPHEPVGGIMLAGGAAYFMGLFVRSLNNTKWYILCSMALLPYTIGAVIFGLHTGSWQATTAYAGIQTWMVVTILYWSEYERLTHLVQTFIEKVRSNGP